MASKDGTLLDDRRGSTRVSISGRPVTIEHDGKTLQAEAGDFNADCFSVFMKDPPPVGSTVKMHCVDDTGKDISFEGSILRHGKDESNELPMIVIQAPAE